MSSKLIFSWTNSSSGTFFSNLFNRIVSMNEFSIWHFLNLSIELLESLLTRRIKRCNSQPASQLKTFLYSRIYFVFEKRMKKTVLAIVGVVLLVAVLVTATHRWGYSQYGAVYYYDYPFFYYDQVAQPPGVYTPFAYERPSLVYPSPLSSDYLYRYDPPSAGDKIGRAHV